MKCSPAFILFCLPLCLAAEPLARTGSVAQELDQAGTDLFAPLPFQLRLRGAVSHYDINDVETQTGGTWGIDGVVPLIGPLGGYGAFKLNHIDGGHQTLASGGLYRQASTIGGSLMDRMGAAVVYDYFTDSRGIDLDITQLRYQFGYLLTSDWAVGIRGGFGIEDELNPAFFNPNAAPGTTALFESRTAVGAFITGYLNATMVDLGVVWRDDVDSTDFELLIRQPLASNFFTFVDTHVSTDGNWLALAGFELRFGGGVRMALRSAKSPVPSGMSRSPWDDPTILNIFNAGEAKTFEERVAPGTSTHTPPAPAPAPVPPPVEEPNGDYPQEPT